MIVVALQKSIQKLHNQRQSLKDAPKDAHRQVMKASDQMRKCEEEMDASSVEVRALDDDLSECVFWHCMLKFVFICLIS